MPIISSCACRFTKPTEFSDSTLIPDSECGYHAAMRARRPEELKIVAWTDGTGFNFLSAATKAHWDAEGWHQEISERYTIPVYQREPQNSIGGQK